MKFRTLNSLIFLLAFTECTTFYSVPEDECGNHIIEENEDCDGETLDIINQLVELCVLCLAR